MNLPRRQFLQFGAAAIATTMHARFTWAQAYPTRPVRIIVPVGPGGPSDVVARVIAEKLSQSLGQPFVVENQAGGANNIGIGNAARAAPDGYTILLVGSNFAINPALFAKIPYDPIKDFAPITLVAASPAVLLVSPTIPPRTVSELVAFLKANPGKYGYATPGIGTVGHLLGEQFKLSQGVDIVHVPFTGMGPVLQSLFSGQTPVAITALTPVVSLAREGKLRALAVTSAARAPVLSGVPTIAEAGLPELTADVPQSFLVPARTPRPIVDLLYREIEKAAKRPDVREKLAAIGFETVLNTPEEFAVRINNEVQRWRRVIRDAKIQAQ